MRAEPTGRVFLLLMTREENRCPESKYLLSTSRRPGGRGSPQHQHTQLHRAKAISQTTRARAQLWGRYILGDHTVHREQGLTERITVAGRSGSACGASEEGVCLRSAARSRASSGAESGRSGRSGAEQTRRSHWCGGGGGPTRTRRHVSSSHGFLAPVTWGWR